MICFFHSSDFDGICSAALVKMRYPECVLVPINYGQSFPWEMVQYEDVYMVDFSLPSRDMGKLSALCNLVWIDHHETALNAVEQSGMQIDGLRRIDTAACALVWEYFYPGIVIPYAVRLLADYDVWKFDDVSTLPFQYGLRTYDNPPGDTVFWGRLMGIRNADTVEMLSPVISRQQGLIEVSRIVEKGQIILEYEKLQNAKLCQYAAFPAYFEGYRVLAMNGRGGSRLFESMWNCDEYDLMFTFYLGADQQWIIGLYTTKPDVNVGAMAKKYGGGGHKGAAGFKAKDISFLCPEKWNNII